MGISKIFPPKTSENVVIIWAGRRILAFFTLIKSLFSWLNKTKKEIVSDFINVMRCFATYLYNWTLFLYGDVVIKGN